MVRDRHLLLARNVSSALQRYHRDVLETFNFTADSLLNKRPISSATGLLGNLSFKSICVVDVRSGRLLAGQSGTTDCGTHVAQSPLDYFRGLAVEGQTVFSGVHASRTGEPVLCLVRLVGRRMVIGSLNTSYFVSLGNSISFGADGHAVIVDQNGRVLAHPVSSWEREMKDLSALAPIKRILAGEQGVDRFFSPALKAEMVAGFTVVEGPGWGVMIPQRLSEVLDMTRNVQFSAFSIFAMALLLAALAACRITLVLLRPIGSVIEGARRMAGGDTSVNIKPPTGFAPAELSALTASFNLMAERVAEARQAEAQARTDAEKANSSKTEFLRTVTHELRSPLSAIIGFAELLSSERGPVPGSERSRSYARDISAGGRHLLSLTNDLLDLAKIEAGKYDLMEDIVGLDEIAARAARYAGPEAEMRGVDVRVECSGEAPNARCDERALFQCVLNLTSNAVRYGNPSSVVTVATRHREDGGAEIAVTDQGPGIAPDDLLRVLEPFQRVSNSQTRDVRGSGLGLPIVKKLVELHGGSFELESIVGSGTTARIVLPAARIWQERNAGQRSAA